MPTDEPVHNGNHVRYLRLSTTLCFDLKLYLVPWHVAVQNTCSHCLCRDCTALKAFKCPVFECKQPNYTVLRRVETERERQRFLAERRERDRNRRRDDERNRDRDRVRDRDVRDTRDSRDGRDGARNRQDSRQQPQANAHAHAHAQQLMPMQYAQYAGIPQQQNMLFAAAPNVYGSAVQVPGNQYAINNNGYAFNGAYAAYGATGGAGAGPSYPVMYYAVGPSAATSSGSVSGISIAPPSG